MKTRFAEVYVMQVMWEVNVRRMSELAGKSKLGVGPSMMICGMDLTVSTPPYMLCAISDSPLLSSVSLSSPSLLPHLCILSISSSLMS